MKPTANRKTIMYVFCDKCKWDSGDRDTPAELRDKVRADGGEWVQTPQGVDVTCPSGHKGDAIHID